MSFLNTLIGQAQASAAEQAGDLNEAARNTKAVEGACKEVIGYFHTLAQQLDILKPPSGGRHTLDKQNVFRNLPQQNFQVDARRKEIGEKAQQREVVDYVFLHWELHGGGDEIEINKDFVSEIEKLEPRLNQSGATVDARSERDPISGRLLHMTYRFRPVFVASVRVLPRHEEGLLTFKVMNLDDFDTVWATLDAKEVNAARLDELARWIVGQSHAFFEGVPHVRRVEP